MSRFTTTPQVRMNRSKFDLSKGIKTSINVGRLYPIDVQEVLPGDTFNNKTTCVARVTSSFIKPVMDNCFLDIYHFFVPYRLCYEDTERVFGNPNPSAYIDNDLGEFPSTLTSQYVGVGTIADYMGLPIGHVPKGINLMPFRAFALIYNTWFRNQNTVPETYVQKDGYVYSERFNEEEWSPNNYTGLPPFVSKKKDYFTSALPSPQKGASVTLGLTDRAPVNFIGTSPMKFYQTGMPNDSGYTFLNPQNYTGTSGALNWVYSGSSSSGGTAPNGGLTPKDGQFYADLSSATASSVNDLRFAFQLQKMLERDALYGSRYNEYLLGHFGVVSPDSRLQLPEYLGGGRIPITVQQVASTTANQKLNEFGEIESTQPLADVGAFSLSNGKTRYVKSFTEHGYVITCVCIRTMHTYEQGINKMWSRLSRNDFYDPLFANLGEQPIYESELFGSINTVDNTRTLKDTVFGYNEAWADYRYSPSRISGQMRSMAFTGLDVWHFGDYYSNAPVLDQQFTNETGQFFDRTLTSPSTSIDNFILDFWFDTKATRVMPLYSVPGLIDHH